MLALRVVYELRSVCVVSNLQLDFSCNAAALTEHLKLTLNKRYLESSNSSVGCFFLWVVVVVGSYLF